jgi:hypothetical protein
MILRAGSPSSLRSRASVLPAIIALGFVAALPQVARAQDPGESDEDTGMIRPYGRRVQTESPQQFAFEARFGPYRADIDSRFGGSGPYNHVFGSDHHLMIGAEFDWQVLRIPMLGTFGPGFGLGYTSVSAPAFVRGTDIPSAENTFLKVLPTYVVGVLRIDVLARETPIPIVPYAKAGLSYALWWTGNDLGTTAKGHSAGTQIALGGMLLLDSFDEDAALQLDNDVGINNSYIFFEWYRSNLDGFGDANTLRVGTSSWILGLAFEM